MFGCKQILNNTFFFVFGVTFIVFVRSVVCCHIAVVFIRAESVIKNWVYRPARK
jgi:hypothetical protein